MLDIDGRETSKSLRKREEPLEGGKDRGGRNEKKSEGTNAGGTTDSDSLDSPEIDFRGPEAVASFRSVRGRRRLPTTYACAGPRRMDGVPELAGDECIHSFDGSRSEIATVRSRILPAIEQRGLPSVLTGLLSSTFYFFLLLPLTAAWPPTSPVGFPK